MNNIQLLENEQIQITNSLFGPNYSDSRIIRDTTDLDGGLGEALASHHVLGPCHDDLSQHLLGERSQELPEIRGGSPRVDGLLTSDVEVIQRLHDSSSPRLL